MKYKMVYFHDDILCISQIMKFCYDFMLKEIASSFFQYVFEQLALSGEKNWINFRTFFCCFFLQS